MRKDTIVPYHSYRAGSAGDHTAKWGTLQEMISMATTDGGFTSRDKDGALAVYDKDGFRQLEVYDR